MEEAYFGGSFDPPHPGHIWIAQQVAEKFNLKVNLTPIFSEAANKWGKKLIASDEQRLRMCRLSIRGFPQLGVCPLEIENKYFFTYQTVRHIRSRSSGEKVKLIVGSDWSDKLTTFENYHELQEICEFIEVNRPDSENPFAFIPEMEFKICSKSIRGRLSAGLPISGLVINDDVEKYITSEGIYSRSMERF